MTDTLNPGNWPDPKRPGVPLNPEQDGWHWLQNRKPDRAPYPVLWKAERGWVWSAVPYFPSTDTAFRYRYLGPCLTPAEVAAREAERDGWKETAAGFLRDLEWMRGLLERIGTLFGDNARRCDDGTLSEDILLLRVPECVEKMMASVAAREADAFRRGAEAMREWAAERARRAIPSANPPRTDGYGHHVAGERAAAERIERAIRALPLPEAPHEENN